MLTNEEPYFMKNKDWYYHDEKEWRYKLTEEGKKIPAVVRSYEEFYDALSGLDDWGLESA